MRNWPPHRIGHRIAEEGAREGRIVPHDCEHFLGGGFLEAGPAEIVLLRGEDGFLDGFLEAVGLVFLEGVELVQALDEKQVGELLDDGERIGDAAGPEGVPDAVDFGFDFACDHWMTKTLGNPKAAGKRGNDPLRRQSFFADSGRVGTLSCKVPSPRSMRPPSPVSQR